MEKKAKAAPKKATKPATVLVLRTCAADLASHNGFKWPASGAVEAPDWQPTKECGNGLHGWLWGAGDWSLKNKAADAKWLVVEVTQADVIDLGGKVKFPRGVVVSCNDHWRDAMAVIRARMLRDGAFRVVATKEGEVASATGHSGHASATGDYGHASATGHYGWAITGYNGTAKADKNGALTLLWHDGKRPRVTVGYVGENGVKAGVAYRLDGKGALVEVKE